MTQPPWPPGQGPAGQWPGYGQRPPSRLRPPWREPGARRAELMLWAAVGLVAWFLLPLLAYALITGVSGQVEAGLLAGFALAVMIVLAAIIGVAFGAPRFRAIGYGVLVAVALLLALVALALIVAAGLCIAILQNQSP
jgi:hypothetical protein